jgi:hypothetical protein
MSNTQAPEKDAKLGVWTPDYVVWARKNLSDEWFFKLFNVDKDRAAEIIGLNKKPEAPVEPPVEEKAPEKEAPVEPEEPKTPAKKTAKSTSK